MGCDGGTIPKRKEIVKNKERQPRKQRAAKVDSAELWKQCAICDWILVKPIVAGHYGHLFCKECIIEYLLECRRDSLQSYDMRLDKMPKLDTVHSLKDIKELKLTDNTDASSTATSGGDDTIKADFVCPITGLETNGQYKFMFSWKCGCVVSERAIKEVPDEKKCLVCQTPYDGEWDLVTLNPNQKDFKENMCKFMARKAKILFGRKDGDKDLPSSQETGSSSSTSQNYMGPSTSTGRRPRSSKQSHAVTLPSHDKPSTSGSQSKKHKS